MQITQVDNRRVAKARRQLSSIKPFGSSIGDYLDSIRPANIKFSWYLDQQSARIARRLGREWFAGVPASYVVEK